MKSKLTTPNHNLQQLLVAVINSQYIILISLIGLPSINIWIVLNFPRLITDAMSITFTSIVIMVTAFYKTPHNKSNASVTKFF